MCDDGIVFVKWWLSQLDHSFSYGCIILIPLARLFTFRKIFSPLHTHTHEHYWVSVDEKIITIVMLVYSRQSVCLFERMSKQERTNHCQDKQLHVELLDRRERYIYIHASLISFFLFQNNHFHRNMSDEGLLITPNSSNKRSFTDQFVDYVKKSKCLFPRDQICSSKRGECRISAQGKLMNFLHSFQVHYVLHIQSAAMIAQIIIF